MKPEDKARLDAAIEHAETIVGSTHNIYEMRWIRGIIDEQDAEIARLEEIKPQWVKIGSDAAWSMAEEQLAEERAKREAAEQDLKESRDNVEQLYYDTNRHRERADKAERELAEERAAHAKADAARVNLRDKLNALAAHSNGVADEAERWCAVAADWKGRAEKAEARAIAAERELERWRHGNTVEGDFVCPNELRAVNAEARLEKAIQMKKEPTR